MHDAVLDLIDWQIAQIETVLEAGARAGEIHFSGCAREQALFVYSTIQGAHTIAKSQRDHPGFRVMMDQLLARFVNLA